MTPDMSVNQMLDSFIYIAKGSRVIDRTAKFDWSSARWMDDKLVKHMVYSVSDLKKYFRRTNWTDHFDDWLKSPRRVTAPTLFKAMTLADEMARGVIEPHIDARAMLRNANKPDWVKRGEQAQ